jgi:magnesium transporter
LVIMRIPVYNINNHIQYSTVPLGVFISQNFILTLCFQDNEITPINQISSVKDRDIYKNLTDTSNAVVKLFLKSGKTYLKYLKEINQNTTIIEQELEKSIKNKELNKLLKMEKCLVYFVTSIKSNDIVLMKFKTSKKVPVEIDEDLLEDAQIENKQALEMSQIYSDIQSGMMDAFASVISNNLNNVMKQLTVISIVLMIPTLVSSVFGMNVPNFLESFGWALPIIIGVSFLVSSFFVILFKRKRWLDK